MFIKDLNAMAQEINSLEINETKLRKQYDALHHEIRARRRGFYMSISEYLHHTLYKCINDLGFIHATDEYRDCTVYEDPKNPSLVIWITKPSNGWNDWHNNSSTYLRSRDTGDYINARHIVYIVQDNTTFKAIIMSYAQYDKKTGDIKFICGSTGADVKDYLFKSALTERCDPKDLYLATPDGSQPFIGESEFVNEVKKIISEKVV